MSRGGPWSWLALALGVAASCKCGEDLSGDRFACQTSDDCTGGEVCEGGLCVPPDGGTAEDAGATDAAASTDAGNARDGGDGGAETATQLVFLPATQSLTAGVCTAATLWAEDALGQVAPTAASTPVALGESGVTGFGIYGNAGCSGAALSSLTFPASATTAVVYVRGTTVGTANLTADAGQLGAASQLETIEAGTPWKLAITTAARTQVEDACSGAATTFQTQDQFGNPAAVATPLPIALTTTPPGALTFYVGPGCGTAVTSSVVIDAGTTSNGVYFRGDIAGSDLLIADGGLDGGAATQTEVVLPLVVRGACTFVADAGATSLNCPINPTLLSTADVFLVFQATTVAVSASYAEVACQIANTSTITCTRAAGTAEPAVTTLVDWQVLQYTSGLSVQQQNVSCSADAGATIPITSVNLADTFLLKSNDEAGVNADGDDLYTAAFSSSTTVQLDWSNQCAAMKIHLQEVTFAGVAATSGGNGPMQGGVLTVPLSPAIDPTTTMLLYSYRTGVQNLDGGAASRLVRGEITDSTTLTFSRALGGDAGAVPIDQIDWTLVNLGALANVNSFTVTMDAGTLSTTVTIPSVDTTRTLVFSPGQAAAGQATGEADDAVDVNLGEGTASFVLTSPTTVTVTRGTAFGSAKFTGQLVQFK